MIKKTFSKSESHTQEWLKKRVKEREEELKYLQDNEKKAEEKANSIDPSDGKALHEAYYKYRIAKNQVDRCMNRQKLQHQIDQYLVEIQELKEEIAADEEMFDGYDEKAKQQFERRSK